MLSVSGEAGGHVIWSRGRSRNQLRLVSKRCANVFSRKADEYDLQERTVTCRGLIEVKRSMTFLSQNVGLVRR